MRCGEEVAMISIQTQCQECKEMIFLRVDAFLEFDLMQDEELESNDSFSAYCPNCNAEIEFSVILSQIQNFN